MSVFDNSFIVACTGSRKVRLHQMFYYFYFVSGHICLLELIFTLCRFYLMLFVQGFNVFGFVMHLSLSKFEDK